MENKKRNFKKYQNLSKKRGATHVGFILSFVIFVTFLVFVLTYFSMPTEVPRSKRILLDYLQVELLKQFSSNLTTVIISAESDECLVIENDELGIESFEGLVAKDENNEIIDFELSSDKEKSYLKSKNQTFFKIYYAGEDFIPKSKQVNDDCGSAEIKFAKTNKYVFETKVNQTADSYKQDYEALKKELNVPPGIDFGFSFTVSTWNVSERRGNGEPPLASKPVISEEWNKTFGGSSADFATSVKQTSDGGYILAGYTFSFGSGESDFWLVKTDSSGGHEWNRTFGGDSYDFASSVQQTSDGGYILAGHTYSFGAGVSDFWLVKTDSSGNLEWDQTFGGSDSEFAYSVQQTFDGGYVIAGYTNSFGFGGDFWFVKTDSSGNHEWNRTFGGSDFDQVHSVQQTSDGGYILAGYTNSFGSGGDFWVIKTDSSGGTLDLLDQVLLIFGLLRLILQVVMSGIALLVVLMLILLLRSSRPLMVVMLFLVILILLDQVLMIFGLLRLILQEFMNGIKLLAVQVLILLLRSSRLLMVGIFWQDIQLLLELVVMIFGLLN
jgi:hypothetical protein